ncbi:MAG: TolC family protein [Brevundimonas sp.]|uniref:TolC family protein n=1 Tax=Brevundimonas sp. TaxID=1871086 RepID=UPI002735D280|nr:TolC family protein [Brevundimonas sp.]MDP3404441.1 TolC family protein [Brevundimonas sp.]
MKTPNTGLAGSCARVAAVSALALSLATLPSHPILAQEPAGATARAPTLSLEQALARAASVDPTLPGQDARARAGDAAVRQADVRPNPTLGLMVENLPTLGGGDLMGRTETTLSYEQRIERGGDRPARVDLARGESALVQAEAAIRRLDRLEQVQRAWAEALGAQADLEIARDRLALAERFQTEVQRRVDMARDPLFAGARAEAELAQAQIDFDQAGIQARLARATLGRFWIGTSDFTLDPADFEDTRAARDIAGKAAGIDLAVLTAQRDVAQARVRVEQARATPDATVSVGVRHVREGQDLGLVVGGSIPLGRYDRNEAAIDRARFDGLAAEADMAALRDEREREIARLQVVLASRALEARRIADETLPQAERAVVLVRDGFNRGGFTYNDVITAQTALLATRARRVAVLKQFHLDRARLDRLTGAHADLLGLENRP